MAVSKWLSRRSFNEAAVMAQEIKNATQAKKERNATLFTAAQESLRRELGLDHRPRSTSIDEQQCCDSYSSRNVLRPSRPRIRVRVKRK